MEDRLMSLANRRTLGCLLLSLFGIAALGAKPEEQDKPKEVMPKLTYAQLGQFIHDQKGKVVYVDFWEFGCVPCKLGLARVLPGLQEKYRDKGFLIVTVNLDDATSLEKTQKPLKFIDENKPISKTLLNFQLNEAPDFAQKTLDIDALPRSYLFDRQGRRVEKYSGGVEHDVLEKRISELLEQK
jgi:thiol-disulfide isomerase/thioredoxin